MIRTDKILETSEHVVDFAVTGAEGWWYSYTHFEPAPLTERVVRRREESEAIVEMPVEVEEDGSLLITLAGDEANVADAMPPDTDAYDVEMLSTGERPPDGDDPFADLTDRQRRSSTLPSAWVTTGIPARPPTRTSPSGSGRRPPPSANTSGRSSPGCSPGSSGKAAGRTDRDGPTRDGDSRPDVPDI